MYYETYRTLCECGDIYVQDYQHLIPYIFPWSVVKEDIFIEPIIDEIVKLIEFGFRKGI